MEIGKNNHLPLIAQKDADFFYFREHLRDLQETFKAY